MTTRRIANATARKLRGLVGTGLLAGSVAGLMFMAGCARPTPSPAAAPKIAPGAQAKAPPAAPQPAIPAAAAGVGTNKIDRFLAGRMPVGFYIYLYNWKQYTNSAATDLDQALAEMARRGFNYLYVGGASDTPVWQRLLEECLQYRIAVIPQLDFAYLGGPKDDIAAKTAQAVPFIKKYKDHPAVMAFSVREEPGEATMPSLKRYYEAILKEVPDARLHLVFDTLGPLRKMEAPYPQIIGTDRYAFWWEFGAGGGRAAPSYALNWFRGQMDAFYREAQARGAEFQAVFTADTLESLGTEEQVRKSFYPEMSEAQRDQYLRTFKENARQKNLGLAEAHDGLYRWWKYYRPPANCTRAMTWLSVLEGAHSILVWEWSPLRNDVQDFAHRTGGKPGAEYICSLTGWDGKGTPQLEEYTETARELQRYAGLIRIMTRDLGKPGAPEKPDLATSAADLCQQSFTVPGYTGKVLVLVNTAVGSWSEGRSPGYPQGKVVYRIDDFGNAVDYTPFTETRVVDACVSSDKLECVDLETSKTVPMDTDGFIKLPLRPGGGRVLYIGPKKDAEWARFKREFRL